VRIRTTRQNGGFSDKIELLDDKGNTFACAWFRIGDDALDVVDQFEWLARNAREHLEGGQD
jgi:hypothetical protein